MRLTLKRLCEKYDVPVAGSTYEDLVSKIIDYNKMRAVQSSQKLSHRRYTQGLKDAIGTGEVTLPVYVPIPTSRKSAQSGKRLIQNVHDALTRELRSALKTHPDNPDSAVEQMLSAVKTIMEPYAGGSPPPHCRTIAETEVRSALDLSKYEYAKQLAAAGLKLEKIWRHAGHGANPRPGHIAMDGVTVDFNRHFPVPGTHGKRVWMKYPHDPDAPAAEVINCGCSFEIHVTGTKQRTEAKKREETG
jgi:hypothetical protein